MTFGDLLQHLVDFVGRLVPFAVVQDYQRGVKVRLGRAIRRVDGGRLAWYWPLLEDVVTYSTVTRRVELAAQSVTIKTGETLTFSLAVRYRICDALLMHTSVYDPHDTTADSVRSSAGHLAAQLSKDDVAGGSAAFATDVFSESVEELEAWGIELEDVGVPNFAFVPVLRLLTGSPESGAEEDD